MSFKITRQPQENTFTLIRKFSTKVKQYKILKEVKEKIYREKPKSRDKKKIDALRKIEIQNKYKRLKKLGKI